MLSNNERAADAELTIRDALRQATLGLRCAMPALVVSVDYAKMTLSAQPTIKGILRTKTGAVAEALLFAAKGGADMAKVREAIQGGFADSRILQLHGQRMVERDFAPRGRMAVQLKDMRNALATAGEIGFDALAGCHHELEHDAAALTLNRHNRIKPALTGQGGNSGLAHAGEL